MSTINDQHPSDPQPAPTKKSRRLLFGLGGLALGLTAGLIIGLSVPLGPTADASGAGAADSSKRSTTAPSTTPEATEEETAEGSKKEEVDCEDPFIRTDVWLENCNEGGENPNAEVDCSDPLALCDENGEPIETVDTPQEHSVGDTFTVGDFEVTVHDVESGVEGLRPDGWETYEEDFGMDWKDDVEYPQLGQFIVATITAKNVGTAPNYFSTDASTLHDRDGREFAPYSYHQDGLDEDQQPDQSVEGVLVWDVPTTVTGVSFLWIQPDLYFDTMVVPAIVNVD